MRAHAPIGEFEQLILLGILRLGQRAHGIDIRREVEQQAERRVTRGALYTALERLERKDLIAWEVGDSAPARGGIPRRQYRVTKEGIRLLRASHRAWSRMTGGLEGLLEKS
jgi:DNA-binding PadR family transcriptional regulator